MIFQTLENLCFRCSNAWKTFAEIFQTLETLPFSAVFIFLLPTGYSAS